VLLAQTSQGIARVVDGGLELLALPGRSLEDYLLAGRLAELAHQQTRGAAAWAEVTIAPPVRRPGKIIIVGLNYHDHAAETGSPLPSFPRFHLVPGSAVTGSGATVTMPGFASGAVDYEGELAVVIGRTGNGIPEDSAWDFVAGGTVANDISARDIQSGENPGLPMASPALAKGLDGFKPLGPALLTTDELRRYAELSITTRVNAEVRQSSSTAELVFTVPELLARISSFLTLEAGDVVLTGTPGGVGLADGRFLKAGDVVTVTIEHIGTLTSTLAEQGTHQQLTGHDAGAMVKP
jgi:2-keto-4-pentenoate hydratase/2-oxohepta-3-ene-1,7-dioic acid hydratase in catechol pathway